MKEVDIAWAAGMLDGEGCIYIARGWPGAPGCKTIQHSGHVSITNCNLNALYELKTLFNGCINSDSHYEKHKPVYKWVLGEKAAAKFLRIVLPYLRIKTKEAQLYLEFRELKKQTRVIAKRLGTPIETIGQRDAYYWALREAKR